MIARLISNPLVVREVRRSTKRIAHLALKYGFAISLVTIFLSLVMILLSAESGHIRLILALFCLLLASVPPLVGYTAATLTVTDIRSKHYELLQMTTISNARLVEGYIVSTLYRCRGILSLIIAFTPLAIYASMHEGSMSCLSNTINSSNLCQSVSSPIFVLLALTAFVGVGITIWGTFFLSATLGVFLAALWRNIILSGIMTVLLALIMIMALILIIVSSRGISELLQRNFICLPIPYLLCGVVTLATRPIVRKTR